MVSNYVINYSIKKDINGAYSKIEDMKISQKSNRENPNDEYNYSKNYSPNYIYECKRERIFFFTVNLNELKNNEKLIQKLSECMHANFTNTGEQEENSHDTIKPFLYVMYDYKTLVHVFKILNVELPIISNVFDIYIVSPLLQLVQRGEKLQNVFSAYLTGRMHEQVNQKVNDEINYKVSNELNEKVHDKVNETAYATNEFTRSVRQYFSYFSTMPPEFSDVLSGKYGIFGWGKYQKMKEEKSRKENRERSNKRSDKVRVKQYTEWSNNNKCNVDKEVGVEVEADMEADVKAEVETAVGGVAASGAIVEETGKTSSLVKCAKKKKPSKEKENRLSFTPVHVEGLKNIKKIAFRNKRSIQDITKEDMICYCITRNCCLIDMFNYLISKFEVNKNLLNIYIKIEQSLILCISEIEKSGIFLNQRKINEIQKNSENPQIYKNEIEELCECNVNLNSSKQVSSLIYKHLLNLVSNSQRVGMEEVITTGELVQREQVKSEGGNEYYDNGNVDNVDQDSKSLSEGKALNASNNDKNDFYHGAKETYKNRNPVNNVISSDYASLNSSMVGKIKMSSLNNTINEMKRNKTLQTNNKMLKLIVDEIEKNIYLEKNKKEKIKKIINNVKLYRESKKLFQNYIENLPKYIQKNTNKIHCNFNQIGASTGRLSCDQPNLQNIHSRFRSAISLQGEGGMSGNGIDGHMISKEERSSNRMSRDGINEGTRGQLHQEGSKTLSERHNAHENEEANERGNPLTMNHAQIYEKQNLITFDYKQMELFVMAYLSFDLHLLKLLNYSDVFVETAKVLFNTNEVTSELRRMTKTVIYGILYGQTENGLAKSLLISDNLASNLIDSFFNYFPNVYKFLQMQKVLVKNMNCVYTLIGRKRVIPPTLKNKFRISMNTPIQGCAADIMKFSLLSCFSILYHNIYKNRRLLKINNIDPLLITQNEKHLKTAKLILQVHDELLLETEQTSSNFIIQLLKPVLENSFYNLIHYTNTTDRLMLLFDYMHDNISIQTYIENFKIINNHNYKMTPSDSNVEFYNSSNNMNTVFRKFNFTLPVKVETGRYYKQSS
ncbi:DNA polymerase 1, putative [Plasmodium malariae]|uniref:DNA polymerase 1, putative n=1 Tax=Plasmodium malariae TaxID=5858 RepID=A0A1C3KZP7_PLAMA|nr:DNA polymerase 1, putative [Plasmodium malariae]